MAKGVTKRKCGICGKPLPYRGTQGIPDVPLCHRHSMAVTAIARSRRISRKDAY